MKNGCGKSFQNDVISVILSQKGENPSLSPLRMRGGRRAQAVLFCSEFLISSLREESATNESREPKTGREARRLCLTSSPADMEGVEPTYQPLLHFTTKRRDFSRIMSFDSFPDYRLGNRPRGGRTPFTDLGDQCFRGRTNPDHQEKG